MKWAWRGLQANPNRESELVRSGWRGVSVTMMRLMIASIIPFFLITSCILWYVFYLDPSWWEGVIWFEDSYAGALQLVGLYLLLTIAAGFVHELIHAAAMPNALSKKVIIGLGVGGGFTYTEQSMSKARYLAVGLAPFVVGCVGLILLGIFRLLDVYNTCFFISMTAGACVDIVMAIFVAVRIPRRSLVVAIKGKGDDLKLYYITHLTNGINA